MAARFTKPYVDALFDVAASPEAVEALLPGLDTFAASLARSEELRSLVGNPGIDRARKAAVVEAVALGEGVADLGRLFLKTLLQNRRLTALPELLRALRARLDSDRHIVEATLTTAAPLDEAGQREIRSSLERRTRGTVRVLPAVDPSLLGGFVVRLGSEVYDASLAHRLEKARLALHSRAAAH